MKNLRQQLLTSLGLVLAVAGVGLAAQRTGGDFVMTKDLFGASGHAQLASTDYSLGFAWGEPVAGGLVLNSSYSVHSGFYAGGFSNGSSLTLVRAQVGRPEDRVYYQGPLQVGVSLHAPITLLFSDQLDESTLPTGVQAAIRRDHRGLSARSEVTLASTYDRTTKTLTITPAGFWTGNTLYVITLSTHIANLDGGPLDQTYQVHFVTLLDPQLENVVLNSPAPDAVAASGTQHSGDLTMHIPERSLSDYSAVLFNPEPLLAPLRINPALIEEANKKALAAGGAYRTLLSIQEIVAYDTRGEPASRLSSPANITMGYGNSPLLAGTNGIIRPHTLSIWALDEEHRLWVKLPASQHDRVNQTITVPVSQFSVFALTGQVSGSASDAFAFPNPWRPYGPRAGSATGQTGTDVGGITFSNLPSECTIRIYTIAGEIVRELKHSDLTGHLGQENWDVKTPDGRPVASGVYLWQVESTQDHKNGKLMVIR